MLRASLEELLTDYRDFLRLRQFQEWGPQHPYALRLRELNRTPTRTTDLPQGDRTRGPASAQCDTRPDQVRTSCSIDRFALEQTFLKEGGLREACTTPLALETNRPESNSTFGPCSPLCPFSDEALMRSIVARF